MTAKSAAMADEFAEEPTLPPLPPSLPLDKRKLSPNSTSHFTPSSASSDPAFFSSDDDPAVDNYENHARRKRRYVGSWFDQQPASSDSAVGEETRSRYPPPRRNRLPRPQKREFRRQLDSGVWMGTEGSNTDTDDCFDLEPAAPRFPVTSSRAQFIMPPSPVRAPPSPEEQAVDNAINFCVEHGTEQVDLSNLRLEHISDGHFHRMSAITPIPTVARDVAFEPRDPRIQLFLSNNRLRALPVALFSVEHLTVLSLRANSLATLPPAIAKLTNLESLNIAQNFIRFLPGELLGLLSHGSKLKTFTCEPNRFWKPATGGAVAATRQQGGEYDRQTYPSRPAVTAEAWAGVTTRMHSRTPVHFLDSTLSTHSRFTVPSPSSRHNTQEVSLELEPLTSLVEPNALARARTATTRTATTTTRNTKPAKGPKSLLQLALAACAKTDQADELTSWLRDEAHGYPAHLAPMVERAVRIHREGGVSCAVCGRDTLMPMAQWVEFRRIGRTTVTVDAGGRAEERFVDMGEGLPVPFLRVGCSWTCVPVKLEEEVPRGGEEEL